MSAVVTLLRPITPSLEAAVAKLRGELQAAGADHNAPAYAIISITTSSATILAGSVGQRSEVARALRAHVRHGLSFALIEQAGDLSTGDFVVAD